MEEIIKPIKVKVALVHAAIAWNDKEYNLDRLLDLNEQAAQAGARIIANPELALSGYSFSGKSEIAHLAETIPGPSTDKFGELAWKHKAYIAYGLPEIDRETGVVYNSAVLIGPTGRVLGQARHRYPDKRTQVIAAEDQDDIQFLCLDPKDARQKRFLELASYDPLLRESLNY